MLNQNSYNQIYINDTINKNVDNILIEKRQYMLYHHSPLHEKYLLQYVKEGNKEKVLEYLNNFPRGQAGILAKDPLRSFKNLFICGATLISRAAIEGGLSSELAFSISDSYIQKVEELKSIDEVSYLYYKLVCDFTDRVHKVRHENYSGIILKCCNYIFKHIYEDITVSKLSEVVDVNPNYLSRLFKNEVGISLSTYIQKQKIEEAKKLLTFTDQSIMDICVSLNFSDQSYFTKVFKKHTQMTPKQYRDQIRL